MRLSARLLCSALSTVGTLPIPLRRKAGRALGTLAAHLSKKERTFAELQLKHYLGQGDPSQLSKQVFSSLGESIFESLNARPYLKSAEQHFTVIGEELVREARARKRPFVALTAHTGNWDLMAAYIVLQGVPLYAAARRARNATLQEVLEWLRGRYGVKTIWRAKGVGAKGIIQELEQNNTIAALIDQDTRVSSVFAPFFGSPARTPSGLIALAKKYQARIVSALNYRTAPGHYTIEIEEFSHGLSIEQIAAQFNNRLERVLLKYPDQWVWFHKRWRSSPTEGSLSGAEYLRRLQER